VSDEAFTIKVSHEPLADADSFEMKVAMSQGTPNAVRTLLVVIVALSGVISVGAQQSEQSEPSAASLKRIRDALQSSQHLISSDVPLIAPSKPEEVQVGKGVRGISTSTAEIRPEQDRNHLVRLRSHSEGRAAPTIPLTFEGGSSTGLFIPAIR
jgi:hypothetical protein